MMGGYYVVLWESIKGNMSKGEAQRGIKIREGKGKWRMNIMIGSCYVLWDRIKGEKKRLGKSSKDD